MGPGMIISDYDAMYNDVMLIRCLLLRDEYPAKWELLNKLPPLPHSKASSPEFQRNVAATAKHIQRFYKQAQFDAKTIGKVFGIMLYNCQIDSMMRSW
jgi:hypothetical protein